MSAHKHGHRPSLTTQADRGRQKSLARFKPDLSRIFFTAEAPIDRFSEDYDNFWKFLPRYEEKIVNAAKKSRRDTERRRDGQDSVLKHSSALSVPCWDRPSSELLQRVVVDRDQRDFLTEEDVEDTRDALKAYLIFLEKQQEKKALKLKEFQEGLPIAEQRDNIVQTLKDNQV
ncbi:putative ATP-dependent RNA helicase DHX34-like, partial [Tropilaelaps mercedesae]